MDSTMIITIIAAIAGSGALTALVGWLKDRRKDASQVEATDIQSLQGKLAYLESLYEFQRKAAADLQKQVEESESARQKLRTRVMELERELDDVRKSARDTQHKCEELSNQLREILDHDDSDR